MCYVNYKSNSQQTVEVDGEKNENVNQISLDNLALPKDRIAPKKVSCRIQSFRTIRSVSFHYALLFFGPLCEISTKYT